MARDRRHPEEVAARFIDPNGKGVTACEIFEEELTEIIRADRRRVLRAAYKLSGHLSGDRFIDYYALAAELRRWERDT